MRASDKLRLGAMESELSDCWIDRYYRDNVEFDAENPDIAKMREELSRYLDESRSINHKVPTYYYYWEGENSRRIRWLFERDPIARGLLMRIDRASRDIIDGRATGRLKRVGDGSHEPVAGQAREEGNGSTELSAI